MNLSFQTSPFFVVLSFVFAAAVSFFIYRYTIPHVSNSKRYVLIGLRTLALLFILFAIFESQFSFRSSTEKLPPFAMLVDNSLSMSQTDRTGNKQEILRNILKSPSFHTLTTRTSAQLSEFSYAVSPLNPESLLINGGVTNISSALEQAQETSPLPLKGILLITDGNYNAGTNPLYVAEKLSVPLYVVGVGDTTEQKDILVSKLLVNTVGYIGTPLPVDAMVKTNGVMSSFVFVSLFEGKKKISEQRLQISSPNGGIAEFPVQFSYTPTSEGIKKLIVSVSTLNGELTEKNNLRSSTIKILKSRLKVIVLAGSPNPDVSAIMQSLAEDKNIESILFTQMPNGNLFSLQTQATMQQEAAGADCIVLEGFPAQSTSSAALQFIVSTIQAHSTSVFFVASRTVDLQKLKQLEPILPFVVETEKFDEQNVLPVLSTQQRLNLLVEPSAEMFPLFSWDKLPPVYTSLSTFIEKPESQKLLSSKIQGVPLKVPLFISHQSGKTKSLAFLGYGLYRWRLLASTANETRGFFTPWISSLIRWLGTHDDDKLFRVYPEKEIFAQGEPINFIGQILNDNFEPVDNVDVGVSITTPANERLSDIILSSLGSGRYDGIASGLLQGDYLFAATATKKGDTLAATKGRFSVGDQSIEFSETKMNKTLLQQLARVTGGVYSDASQFDSLAQRIFSNPDIQTNHEVHIGEFQLWNLPAWLSIIIFLFGIEWFIRKRSGML